jgi:hypothetical protein
MKEDLEQPGAIGLALHRRSCRLPSIKVTCQKNLFCARRDANKVNGLGHVTGRITVWSEKGANFMHGAESSGKSI